MLPDDPGRRGGARAAETASLGLPRSGRRAYLLIVRSASSTVMPLPEVGELVIGRAADVEITIDDAGASRRHASLSLSAAGARLTDLGSRHGTSLNGLRLGAPRELRSGDVIGVGEAVLVVHLPSVAAATARALDDSEALRGRIEQEIDRARAYELSFAVLALGPFTTASQRLAASARLGQLLPARDTLASDADGFVCALLPELDHDEALRCAARLLRAPELAGASLGVAAYPRDACTAPALVHLARRAAAASASGSPPPDAGAADIVVASPAMTRLYSLVRRLARSDLPVLIRGETGVGKEHAAQAVHAWSPRSQGPFLAANCAALSETLIESILFGHERGAFTGATERRIGLFEGAASGTLFLDEIGELPLSIQAKLLRAVELRRITRLGAVKEIPIDVRFVAATHRDLAEEVKAGRFRQDLLFRLGASVVEIPPLRDRPEELLLLAQRFLAQARAQLGRPHLTLAGEVAHRLAEHPWPGNVRELRNAIAYAAAVAEADLIQPWDLPEPLCQARLPPEGPTPEPTPEPTLEPPAPARPAATFLPLADEIRALERQRIEEALVAADGVQRRAAALLHMPLRTFCVKLRQYELSWPERWRRRDPE